MTVVDRLSSDHDTVETHRVAISRVGGTDRPQIELPPAVGVGDRETIRIVLDGTERHARPETAMDGTDVVRWVADNPRRARERDGQNRLVQWVDESGNLPGDSVHLDVVTPGFKYGVRTPGTTVVYDATASPSDSLADIARDLED